MHCSQPVQISSVPWLIGMSKGHEERFGREPVPVFSAEGHREQFWHGQGCTLFDVVHPAFPTLATALSTLQGALKDDFGELEAVILRGMPEPCEFPSPDTCQKKCLWAHKEVDLAPHPVVGLLLHWFQKPGSFSQSQQAGSVSRSQRGGWGGEEVPQPSVSKGSTVLHQNTQTDMTHTEAKHKQIKSWIFLIYFLSRMKKKGR